MRASEIISEVTNPSAPPPRKGDPEFIKSQQYYSNIVDRIITNNNNELNFLSKTNPTEFKNKTADEKAMRDELRDEIVIELLKRGGQNFISRDKDKLLRAFNLQDTNTNIDPTTKNISVNDAIKNTLTNTATDTFYQNRYIRFTNQALWAKLGGGRTAVEKYSAGIPVPKITAGGAKGIVGIIGVDVDESNFWKYIKVALSKPIQTNGIYKILIAEYPDLSKPKDGTVPVKNLTKEAGQMLYHLFGISTYGNTLFWPKFTDGLNDASTLDAMKNIFNKTY